MSSIIVPDSFELRGRAFTGLGALPPDEARRLYAGAVRYGTGARRRFDTAGRRLEAALDTRVRG